jgi:glyoxylase-like metal-dependent hydrolase (beta-lactamase superfamily II)
MLMLTKNYRSIRYLSVFLFASYQVFSQSGMPLSRHFIIENLADGIYAAINNDQGGAAICNAGIIDLGNKTIIIDPFLTPAAAQDLKNTAEYLTGRKTSLVINTHYHNDHTRGNQVFKPEALIIATTFTRTELEKTFYNEIANERRMTPSFIKKLEAGMPLVNGQELAEMQLWHGYYQGKMESFDELKLTLPDITVDDSLTIHGSLRSVKIIGTGVGHSGGDLIVWLPDDRVAFMGDQLFNQRHPYLGAGDPNKLLKNIKDIALKFAPEITVPGHGPVGNLATINELSDYINALSNIVKAGIGANKSENEILATPIPDTYQSWLLSTFYPINLKVLYDRQK